MPYPTPPSIIQLLYKPFDSTVAFLVDLYKDCCTVRHLYSFLAFTSCVASLSALLHLIMRWRRGERSGVRGGGSASGSSSADTRRAPRAPSTSASSQRRQEPAQQQQGGAAKQDQPTPLFERSPSVHSPQLPPTPSLRIQTEGLRSPGTPHDPISFDDSPTTDTTQIIPGPFSHLPREIVENIFLYTLPPPDAFPTRGDLPPVSLRQVCRHWKTIFDRLHPMWRSLNPVLSTFHCPGFRPGHFLRWYQRVTSRIPKFNDITIEFPVRDLPVDSSLLRYLLDLCTRSSAIKVVMLGSHARTSPVFDLLAPNPRDESHRGPSDGPRLDMLRVIEWHMLYPFSRPLPHSFGLPWSSLSALPWDQLTSVRLYLPTSLQDCVFIFDHAKVLEHIVLRSVSRYREEVHYPAGLVELSHLRSLEIESEFNLSRLFQMYSMPELRRVELKPDRNAAPNLLALPWPQLTEVVLDCDLTVETAEGLLRNLNLVEKFSWKGTLADDEDWSLNKRLASLKSFVALPEQPGGFRLGNHLVRHILPLSIEVVDIPLIPSMAAPINPRTFASLRKATLNQAITPSDFFLFLSCTPNLQSGVFTVEDGQGVYSASSPTASPSSPTYPPSSPITPTYPHITSRLTSLHLKLGLEYSMHTERFFTSFSLPNITSLSFTASKRGSSDCHSLVAMLARGHSPIKQLHLRCQGLGDDGVVLCLRAFSATLVEFVVNDSDFGSPFGGRIFQALTHGANSSMSLGGCLCPLLERLDLSPCVPQDALGLLHRMIRSRSRVGSTCVGCGRGVRKIESVRVEGHTWNQGQVGDLTEWRRKWKEKGIRVDLGFAVETF